MRAILLENDDDIAALFPVIFARTGITLRVVTACEDLYAEEKRLHLGGFLLLDCSNEYPGMREEVKRVLANVSRTTYIISYQAEFVEQLTSVSPTEIKWLPADIGVHSLLAELHHRLSTYAHEHVKNVSVPRLSPREQHVVHKLVQGMTNAQIAVSMEVQEGTVKTFISRVSQKYRFSCRGDLLRYFQTNRTWVG